MLKVAICEDNPIHSEKIRQVAEGALPGPFEIHTYTNALDFEKAAKVQSLPYDLVLMDIDLGGDSGISLAEKINTWNPGTQIIYISQHIKYASAVYETEHVYFIDKDHLEDYLGKAVHKAVKQIQEYQQQFLFFRNRQVQYSLLQKDILYMERIMRNTEIHTMHGNYITRERLPVLKEQLSPAFALCHRSFLVNFKRVTRLCREELTLCNGTVLPVGRSYYDNAKEAFANIIL